MPLPLVQGYLDGSDSPEHEKDQSQNKVIRTPEEACVEERQDGEQSKVARLGVHSPSRLERGSDQAAPSPVRELTALNRYCCAPAGGRQAIFLGATEPRAARPKEKPPAGNASRPRQAGDVNEVPLRHAHRKISEPEQVRNKRAFENAAIFYGIIIGSALIAYLLAGKAQWNQCINRKQDRDYQRHLFEDTADI
jgi:hypothetical protein